MAWTSGPDQLRPGARNPGAAIFARLHAAGLQQLVGIRIPLAVRIVAPEHGSSRLRLLDNAHCVIGFHEARQSFLDLIGGGIALDDSAETLDGTEIFLA